MANPRQGGLLRFVKFRKNRKTGKPVARCNRMLRFTVEDETGELAYRFLCKECGWRFPYGHSDVPPYPRWTTRLTAPVEVRLHVQAHYPNMRWAKKKWGYQRMVGSLCPSCGFDVEAWRPLKKGT